MPYEPKNQSTIAPSRGTRIFEIRQEEAEALRTYAVDVVVRNVPHIAAFVAGMLRNLKKR
jgi:hypothetical protein